MAALGEMKGMKTMDDFISRKALLERLDNRTRTAYPNELYGLMLAHDYISDAPAVETGSKWIPVTERLPELIPCDAGTAYSEAVNVLTSGRKVLTAIWDGTDFIADAEFWEAEGEEITHWTPVLLPLPEEGGCDG